MAGIKVYKYNGNRSFYKPSVKTVYLGKAGINKKTIIHEFSHSLSHILDLESDLEYIKIVENELPPLTDILYNMDIIPINNNKPKNISDKKYEYYLSIEDLEKSKFISTYQVDYISHIIMKQ